MISFSFHFWGDFNKYWDRIVNKHFKSFDLRLPYYEVRHCDTAFTFAIKMQARRSRLINFIHQLKIDGQINVLEFLRGIWSTIHTQKKKHIINAVQIRSSLIAKRRAKYCNWNEAQNCSNYNCELHTAYMHTHTHIHTTFCHLFGELVFSMLNSF